MGGVADSLKNPMGRASATVVRDTPDDPALAREQKKLVGDALQTPTLTDILMRDVASGQVRSLRKGSRRGTFSGGAMSPYGELPPLGS